MARGAEHDREHKNQKEAGDKGIERRVADVKSLLCPPLKGQTQQTNGLRRRWRSGRRGRCDPIAHLRWRYIRHLHLGRHQCRIVLNLWLRPSGPARLDALGLVLLPPGCAVIVYGLAQAGQHGRFTDRAVVIPVLAGLLLLAGSAVHALRTRTEPLIDLRLLRTRTFAASSAVVFLSGLALFGAIILLPLYYQQVRAASPLHAGLLLAPQEKRMETRGTLAPPINGSRNARVF